MEAHPLDQVWTLPVPPRIASITINRKIILLVARSLLVRLTKLGLSKRSSKEYKLSEIIENETARIRRAKLKEEVMEQRPHCRKKKKYQDHSIRILEHLNSIILRLALLSWTHLTLTIIPILLKQIILPKFR